MVISKTPLRISFIGGGTDFRDFYQYSLGKVFSTSINKYLYVIVRKQGKIHDYKYRINWSKTEFENDINKIEHPIVRETFKLLNIDFPIEVSTFSDIPAYTGLGSSSAFTVGLINALLKLKKIKSTKKRIAELAIKIEVDILKRNIGKQDHYACTYGGINEFLFHKDGKTLINPVKIDLNKKKLFFNNLLIFFTGRTRDASKILTYQKQNISNKFETLTKMRDLVDISRENFLKGNFNEFAKNLSQNWFLKKKLSPLVSNKTIDYYFHKALNSGAAGGKLLGAGGGGFLCFYVENMNQKKVIKSLLKLNNVPISYDIFGTKIIKLKK